MDGLVDPPPRGRVAGKSLTRHVPLSPPPFFVAAPLSSPALQLFCSLDATLFCRRCRCCYCSCLCGSSLYPHTNIAAIFFATKQEDLRPSGATRSRLAYDELLASQIVLALRRRQTRGIGGDVSGDRRDQGDVSDAAAAGEMARVGGAALVEEGRRRLPFDLTSSQNKGASIK